MLIDTYDVSDYNAYQFKVDISHADMENKSSEWAHGASVPYFGPIYLGFKEIDITLAVHGSTREAIIQDCSDIAALLKEPVDLTLDGFTHKFKAILAGTPKRTERIQKRYHQLDLSFVGYEYGEEVTISGASSITVNNPGNMVSPAVITITPSIGVASIELTGLCRNSFTGADLPVTIETLTTGNAVVINGLTGLVTENNAIKEVDAWALPSFPPGDTVVTCDSEYMTISVTVTPLYM